MQKAAAAEAGAGSGVGAEERLRSGGSELFEGATPAAMVEAAGVGKVPGLPLAQAGLLGSGDADASGTPTTRRAGADPTTARGVEVLVDGGATERDGKGGTGAHKRARFGGEDDGGDGQAARRQQQRGAHASDGGSDEVGSVGGGARKIAGKHQRGGHQTEEEREAAMAARGTSKARAWLESDFHHVSEQQCAVCAG